MKNSIQFLNRLSRHNSSEWMKDHRDEYLRAKEEFEFLVQEMIARISQWDDGLSHLEPRHCIFRLNRDVRFSDNKKPYKENFGAFMAYGGKKGGLPGYYFHFSPKEIFSAGGLWMPEADKLQSIRRYISDNGEELVKILRTPAFKKAFSKLEDEQALKRPPKGFSPADPYLEFLKLKSFIVSQTFKVEEALKPGFGKKIDKSFRLMKPLNDFLMEGLKANL